jgi:ferrous iron transport protein B
MAFILLAAPCLAAIGATKKEMGSWKWTLITITFQTAVAYIVSLIIYQGGTLLATNKTIFIGLIIFALIALALVRVLKKRNCHCGCDGCSKACDMRK